MEKKIKLMIADDIQETRDVIRQLIDLNSENIEIIAEAQNGAEAVLLARQYKPDLILMDINMPELNGLEATARIVSDNPGSVVIIMSVQSETEYLKQAMFSGAKEYIIKPFDYDTLMGTLLKTYERHHSTTVENVPTEPTGQVAKVFSFFSTKGGVGKSFLALSTALVHSMIYKKKTLLIDFDLQFGDISLMIDRVSAKSLADCVSDGEYKDYDAIASYLIHYNEYLDILIAPKSPEEAESIQSDVPEIILQVLQHHYDTILMDLPISFSDLTLSVLDRSDCILYVSTMDILSLKNTKTGLSVMKSLNYPEDKIKIIINSRNESYGIKMVDVEKLFTRKPFTSIVEDQKGARLSINMGTPYLMNPKNKGSKLYKEIVELSNKMIKG